MDKWTVQLKPAEQTICTWVGQMRYNYAKKIDLDPGLGPSKDAEDAVHDIRGACCEFAGSLITNLYWRPSIGEIHNRDVGGLIEVRSTVIPHGRLIVKPEDDDEAPFALVRDCGGRIYWLLGWLLARHAKKFPLLKRYGDPAHFVDQKYLLKPVALMRWIADAREGELTSDAEDFLSLLPGMEEASRD